MLPPQSPEPTLQTGQINSLDALHQALQKEGINYAQWGTGSAKSVENLWTELTTGEIALKGSPLCRVLSGVVQVVIRRPDGRILIDSEQIFKDGRCRKRNIPPSEKMLPGETFVDAARRCLVEELHIKPQNITIYPETHKMRQERRDSYSYPGLPSLYTIHSVEVAVRGIPQQDFRTFELNNPGEGVVREHRWAWQSPPPELA
jgi:hypothetical protein